VRVLLLARYVISALNDINKVLLESSVFSLYYYLEYFVWSLHVAFKRKQEISVGEDHRITREDSVTKIKEHIEANIAKTLHNEAGLDGLQPRPIGPRARPTGPLSPCLVSSFVHGSVHIPYILFFTI
jgi:hypothetical protein